MHQNIKYVIVIVFMLYYLTLNIILWTMANK